MFNKNWMKLGVLLIVSVLFLTVSCSKKSVKSGSAGDMKQSENEQVIKAREQSKMDAAAKEAEMARQKALEEQRIREQRLKDQQAMEQRQMEMASSREMQAGRSQFMEEDVYFEFDKSTLVTAAQDVLKKKADFLRKNPNVSVTIEGHCDERGTTEYNLALGERRAQSAKTFLINLGITASRLDTISYGEEKPVDPAHNEGAWSKNRRAHFVIK
ncbi:MAG: peptidoglycan-associated lipoprotein Pal [Desulfobacterales bacterium]|nr:peptidoglycan-associated lipoprotein Pal [Desulfobacterales bacterium]